MSQSCSTQTTTEHVAFIVSTIVLVAFGAATLLLAQATIMGMLPRTTGIALVFIFGLITTIAACGVWTFDI
jgi:hypothetical protein